MQLLNQCYAIDPNRAMSQYIHDRWGTEQGFPRGPVYAITQTADGYLWIGAEEGLIRFDGFNFRLIEDTSGTFQITNVLGLTPDDDGSLWVRLQDLTVLRYRNGVFDNPTPKSELNANITAMSKARDGKLLVSRMEEGAFAYQSGAFRMLATSAGLPRSPVIALAQTADGTVWMGTRDAGLFRVGEGRPAGEAMTSAVTKGLPDSKINCLLADGDSGLWIGTDNGIVRWNGTELTAAGIPKSLSMIQVLTMARDRDANIWVGTDSRGLLRFNAQGVSALDPREDQRGPGAPEAVTAVFEDREGSLWIGTASGLERLRDSAFVTYSLPEGVPSDGSNPVFVDAGNRTWFPPISGGLWWLKDGRHEQVTEAGLKKDVVYSIAGRDNDLWLGRRQGGLTRLRFEGGSFHAETYTKANGLAQDSVYSVYLARDGTVWAGTLSGGVSKMTGGGFTSNTAFATYTSKDGLASNTVVSMLETSDGTMWFATPTGLSALSAGHWRTYRTKDGLPSDNVNCLFEDSHGVLWIGTTAGVAFRDPDRFQVPRGTPPSLHEQILGIAEDKFGSLWMSTSNHAVRVKRDRLLDSGLADGDLREYGIADGLRGVEGVKRHRSVVTDPLGRIWFSMNRGISVVDPARLTGNSAPAIVHVQAISADGNTFQPRAGVHVPAKSQRITLSYTGLNLAVPERVRFRFRLDGFDHAWNGPIERREAIYTNLDPGPYTFHVIASNTDGAWNGPEETLAFVVDPAVWQTWWFRVGVALTFALAMLALYRLRLHQLTQQLNIRFEERLAERTHIAQELHDTLLQGFLSASMQLDVALDRLPEDSPARPLLGRVLNLMRQVIDEGRNTVRGLRSSHSASLDLEHSFSQIRQELGIEEEIAFRVIVDGQPRPLRPLLRDEVYRIGREALVNAFRHSGAKNIEIELQYAPKGLRLLVRDNGSGIDPQVLKAGREGHWGLPGMRERAERMGARLQVWSSAIAGTEVELSVPSKVAFNSNPSGRMARWNGWLRRAGLRTPEPEIEPKSENEPKAGTERDR